MILVNCSSVTAEKEANVGGEDHCLSAGHATTEPP